jgi:hypothetical protein
MGRVYLGPADATANSRRLLSVANMIDELQAVR